ncbi:unnamed protein product, partial [Polarella glacialis]
SQDLARRAKDEHAATCKKLEQAFRDGDVDGNGELSKTEFIEVLSSPEMVRTLHQAGIDASTAGALFDILDIDGSDSLDSKEFMEGVLRSRGNAQNKDMIALRCDVWRASLSVQTEIDSAADFLRIRLGNTADKLKKLHE